MARIRSVSPELRTSLTCAEWPRETRYAWVMLWGYLDDYGRGVDNDRIIAADCFPLDDDVSPELMGEWLNLFEKAGSICRYEHDGKRYLHTTKWGHWQKPQHPGKVRVPPCPEHEKEALAMYELAAQAELMKVSGKSHEGVMTVSPPSKEGEKEGELRRRRSQSAASPRCPLHRNHPSPPPCGPCKDARIAWERSNAEPKPALSVVPANLRCPDHGELAGACTGCAVERSRTA